MTHPVQYLNKCPPGGGGALKRSGHILNFWRFTRALRSEIKNVVSYVRLSGYVHVPTQVGTLTQVVTSVHLGRPREHQSFC